MPPPFNLSQDQSLQFKFDLFNRIAIVAKPSPPRLATRKLGSAAHSKSLQRLKTKNLARPRREPKCMSATPTCLHTRTSLASPSAHTYRLFDLLKSDSVLRPGPGLERLVAGIGFEPMTFGL